MNFMYLNAAWWYFGMLIQFYLIFPLLFLAARKFGAWIFLLIACGLGFFVRYLMLDVYPVHGLWTIGGFAICRLPEFAFGMALGMWHTRSTSRVESLLLRGPGLIAGIALYPAALWLYDANYVFVDFATGACCFLALVGIAGLISRVGGLGKIVALVGMYSYGLYLIHQPYVIWLGLKIRPHSIVMFILIFVITAAVLSAWGIVLEKTTNALVNKLLPARKPAPA
jgi:peptidoglycan/LPS O-acetylase OafA/YrhL